VRAAAIETCKSPCSDIADGQQFFQCCPPVLLVIREDHRPHVRDAVFGEEHVLGAAQADPFGAECACLDGIARLYRHSRALQSCGNGSAHFISFCRSASSDEASSVFGAYPSDYAPGRSQSSEIQSPSLNSTVFGAHLAGALIDLNVARTRDAALSPCRAWTTAAWLVMPPRDVRIPAATSIPEYLRE